MGSHERFDTYRNREEPHAGARPWLCAILRNIFYNQHRSRRRQPHSIPLTEQSEREPADLWRHTLSSRSPEALLIVGASLSNALDALESLPPRYRHPLVLSVLEDLSYDEVAVRLGLPIGTVRSRLFRARARMVYALEHCGFSRVRKQTE
jgi:RNA polymerase sigma-70 factor (ECF subfamily)